MGNKTSKHNKSDTNIEDKKYSKPTPKPMIESDSSDKYQLIPSNAKFKKIDLVKYGTTFDKYTPTSYIPHDPEHISNNIQSHIQQIITNYQKPYTYNNTHKYNKEKWYLFPAARAKIIGELSQYQFPLHPLLRFCVSYNQNELLEFILTQELIDCDYWSRDYFLCNIFDIIRNASRLMKLSPLTVIAAYMIPERINKEDFQSAINEAYGQHRDDEQQIYYNLCHEMVEEGMNVRAQRIIQTKQALMNNIDCDFPKELIGVVIAFAFGMSYTSNSSNIQNIPNDNNHNKTSSEQQNIQQVNTLDADHVDIEIADSFNKISKDKMNEFVAEYEYFDGLDFSRSTSPMSSVNTSKYQLNQSPTSPLNKMQIDIGNTDAKQQQLEIPPLSRHDTGAISKKSIDGKSFSNAFFGEVTEMSSTMFINYKKENSDDNLTCTVCLEPFKPHDCIGKLMCNHIFHKKCIYEWLRKTATCPLCREDVKKFANVPFL